MHRVGEAGSSGQPCPVTWSLPPAHRRGQSSFQPCQPHAQRVPTRVNHPHSTVTVPLPGVGVSRHTPAVALGAPAACGVGHAAQTRGPQRRPGVRGPQHPGAPGTAHPTTGWPDGVSRDVAPSPSPPSPWKKGVQNWGERTQKQTLLSAHGLPSHADKHRDVPEINPNHPDVLTLHPLPGPLRHERSRCGWPAGGGAGRRQVGRAMPTGQSPDAAFVHSR